MEFVDMRSGSWTAAALRVMRCCLLPFAVMMPVSLVGGGAVARGGPQPSIALDAVPIPHQVHTRTKPVAKAKTVLVPFDTAPFPYSGRMPRSNRPFLETSEDGRRYHRSGRGQLLWEDPTFSDNRVLLHIPPKFDARRPGIIVIFYHGHGANLSDDVFMRQQVPAQLAGTNAVLVAPQLAKNAADSSPGKLWQPGAFARFLGEASHQLAALHGDKRTIRSFAAMPVVIVAYSGGYVAAAQSIRHGGIGKRLRGVILLDALYGEIDTFAAWLANDPSRMFVSAYTSSTQRGNRELQRILSDRRISYQTDKTISPASGKIVFVPTGSGSLHRDFLTHAWADYPLADVLQRLAGYSNR